MSIRARMLLGGKNDHDDCQPILDILKEIGVEYNFWGVLSGVISASPTVTYIATCPECRVRWNQGNHCLRWSGSTSSRCGGSTFRITSDWGYFGNQCFTSCRCPLFDNPDTSGHPGRRSRRQWPQVCALLAIQIIAWKDPVLADKMHEILRQMANA